MTVRKRNEYEIEVASSLTEDWLNEIIEKSREGYRIIEGTVQSYALSKIVVMTNEPEVAAEELVETFEEEEEVVSVEDKTALDMELIESFEGDKDLLEDYGKEFGIDLRKNKKFENMLTDLKEHVGI